MATRPKNVAENKTMKNCDLRAGIVIINSNQKVGDRRETLGMGITECLGQANFMESPSHKSDP